MEYLETITINGKPCDIGFDTNGQWWMAKVIGSSDSSRAFGSTVSEARTKLLAILAEGASTTTPPNDPINNPRHYTAHPSGIECIQITEHMGFCLGNAIKYIFRADHKGNAIEDLKKARWYIEREIQRREGKPHA